MSAGEVLEIRIWPMQTDRQTDTTRARGKRADHSPIREEWYVSTLHIYPAYLIFYLAKCSTKYEVQGHWPRMLLPFSVPCQTAERVISGTPYIKLIFVAAKVKICRCYHIRGYKTSIIAPGHRICTRIINRREGVRSKKKAKVKAKEVFRRTKGVKIKREESSKTHPRIEYTPRGRCNNILLVAIPQNEFGRLILWLPADSLRHHACSLVLFLQVVRTRLGHFLLESLFFRPLTA